MPWLLPGAEELVVRPTLAILYRIALGPFAEGWARRFLQSERSGRPAMRWHWPAFLFPAGWAFYRRLWFAGAFFAALPLLCAAALAWVEPMVRDASDAFLGWAIGSAWWLPAVLAALTAGPLLHRRVRRDVSRAEAASERSDEVAARLAAGRRTAPLAALLLGVGALGILALSLRPGLAALHEREVVRARVAAALAAAAPLKAEIEAAFRRAGALPRRLDRGVVEAMVGAALVEAVDLNPSTGRLRLSLGPGAGEAAGKSLLLAPALDRDQQIHWYCFPVDLPARVLPSECRRS
jgi:hypothetical protein